MKEAELDDMKYLRQDSKESAKLREAISKIREMEAVPGRKKKVRNLRAYIRLNYRGEYADFLGNELRRFL